MARRHRDHVGRFVLGMKHYPDPDDDGSTHESKARGHGNKPLMVENVNPMEDHPGLTPLEHRKIRRIAGKGKRSSVKVQVKVEAKHGDVDAD